MASSSQPFCRRLPQGQSCPALLQELEQVSRQLQELQTVTQRAVETASSALSIPRQSSALGELAVDQLVDTLILKLQVRITCSEA